MDIKNKVTVITGASEGIGAATARVLAREGARLVLAARSDEKLAALAKELDGGANDPALESSTQPALAVHTDMRSHADIQNLIDRALEVYGRLDVLINNAGQGLYGPVEAIDLHKYREVMELNVYAPLRAMQLVIPIMRKQGGGMILNISSRVSKNYFPSLAAYASTKYALNALSLTARTELEADHIVVSVFHPKMTATNFGKNSIRVGMPEGGVAGNGASANATGGAANASGASGTAARRPNSPEIDTPEAVAEQIAKQIQSEAPEAEM